MALPQIIDDLIILAWNYEASDLFLTEGRPGRVKASGRFIECGETVVGHEDMRAFWQICGQNPEEVFEKDVAYNGPNRSRWRISLHRTFGRLGATLRQIRPTVPTFESLGLPEALLENWMHRRAGLVLVTGPTGCGKSTTLASCMEYVNSTRSGHIVTIEDPIEYCFTDRMCFFTQREVGIDTASFGAGLRAALRQAPDVILLGEIRDSESAVTAVQAAETGHLVIGTLHASHVADTLERFIRLVPAVDRIGLMAQLSQQLIGIFAQKLLKGTAKRSLIPICEYLTAEGAVRDWIRDNEMPRVLEHMRRGGSQFCCTQMQSLADAYHAGKIDFAEAMAHATNPSELDRMLRGIS